MKAKSPNRTRIDWCDFTINPITGCPGPGGPNSDPITQNCIYCFAVDQANRQRGRNGYPAKHPFDVTFHADKLLAIYGIPRTKGRPFRVFLDSMGDMFNPEVQPWWLKEIFIAVRSRPDVHFIALTKFLQDIACPVYTVKSEWDIEWPRNLAIGVSVKSLKVCDRIPMLLQEAPKEANKAISFEPLMGPIGDDLNLDGIGWIIVGQETGRRKEMVIPKFEWINDLIYSANNQEVPIFLKNNLRPSLFPALNEFWLQEFPEWF